MQSFSTRLQRWSLYLPVLGVWQATRLAFGLYPTFARLRVRGLERSVSLRPRTSDAAVFHKFFAEPSEPPFRLQPRVIVDAGANIGLSVLRFRQLYPEAQIIAIEPEAANFELLRQNTAHDPRVVCIRGALWPRKTAVAVESPDGQPWSFACAERPDAGATVTTLTPDELVDLAGGTIDLLKLDIEGAERDLFEADDTGWLRRVRAVVIEFHDRMRPGCAAAFYRQIRGADFQQEVCNEDLHFLLPDPVAPPVGVVRPAACVAAARG